MSWTASKDRSLAGAAIMAYAMLLSSTPFGQQPAQAFNLCDIIQSGQSFEILKGGQPPERAAASAPGTNVELESSIVSNLEEYSGLSRHVLWLWSTDRTAKARSQTCGEYAYIFYNESYVRSAPSAATGRNWTKYFIFAHEFGHHVNRHTYDNQLDEPEQERQADGYAGWILGQMGATVPQIVNAVEWIQPLTQTPSPGYPSGCERRRAAIAGYNRSARQKQVESWTVFDDCSIKINALLKSPAVPTVRDVLPGNRLVSRMLQSDGNAIPDDSFYSFGALAAMAQTQLVKLLPMPVVATLETDEAMGASSYDFVTRTYGRDGRGQIVLGRDDTLHIGSDLDGRGYILDVDSGPLEYITTPLTDSSTDQWIPPELRSRWTLLWSDVLSNADGALAVKDNPIAASQGRTAMAAVGHTYLIRHIYYGRSDVLVAFTVTNFTLDRGIVIVWKLLKRFADPPTRR